MVRVFLKGGVWKNSEDEILKAAVQKYGKQQWARVASLLNRKSAKQAKARWYEWLDPAIKKIEWTVTEEEQLLHLSKLLPAQWKTIAATLGRTATQCQEHYEYLLDQAATAAAAAAAGGDNAAGAAAAAAASSSSLRAGQIDSHPETKPARPDPIDMDEDEMEMLQEARARLANTQGKKAKRKQRERMLLAAKRFADLQKRRELKQAGLLSKAATQKSKKSKREIDYGVEIPFYKPAPAGFHNVERENATTEKIRHDRITTINYKAINEQQYRSRDREAAQIRKREESRMRILQQSNDTYKAQVAAATTEEDAIRNVMKNRIGPFTLPQPTITDSDLTQLAKLQQKDDNEDNTLFLTADEEDDDGKSMITKSLLGDYSTRTKDRNSNLTEFLTGGGSGGSVAGVSTVTRQQSIRNDAAQLRKLQSRQTPLLLHHGLDDDNNDDDDDDDNDDHVPDADEDDGDDDLDNKKPAAKSTSGADSVHQPSVRTLRSIMKPTIRDQFGLNTSRTIVDDVIQVTSRSGKKRSVPPASSVRGDYDDAASVGASTLATSATNAAYSIRELARIQRRAAKRVREELDAAFSTLPQPQYEYELAAPENIVTEDDEDNTMDVDSTTTKDREDIEAEEARQRQIEAEKLYQQRNTVMKRPDLPRPVVHRYRALATEDSSSDLITMAQQLIRVEMMKLLQYDTYDFPIEQDESTSKKKKDKSKKKRDRENDDLPLKPPPPLEKFTEIALEEAKQLLHTEFDTVLNEKISTILTSGAASNHDDAMNILVHESTTQPATEASSKYVYTPSGWIEAKSDEDKITSLQYELELLQKATSSLRKKNDKVESKLKIITGGYQNVADKLTDDIIQSYRTMEEKTIEENVYKQLQQYETRGGQNRIADLKNVLATLKKHHIAAQKQYGELLVQQKRKQIQQQSKQQVSAN